MEARGPSTDLSAPPAVVPSIAPESAHLVTLEGHEVLDVEATGEAEEDSPAQQIDEGNVTRGPDRQHLRISADRCLFCEFFAGTAVLTSAVAAADVPTRPPDDIALGGVNFAKSEEVARLKHELECLATFDAAFRNALFDLQQGSGPR